jgi:3-deoxy-manno-octulosonate cytidylyltransferase (CMP-KDO synthetase)
MSVVAVIPARMGSKRLPAKVLADVQGTPLVAHVWHGVMSCPRIDRVLIATDSDEVAAVMEPLGAEVVRSQRSHSTGTDRVAEAVAEIDAQIVLNVQADNAFLERSILESVISCFDDPSVHVATSVCPFPDHLEPTDSSKVKAAIGKNGNALYFSRAPVPHGGPWWLHVGVYGFRARALSQFSRWKRGSLEAREDLEQLRFIENGIAIRTVQVAYSGVGIDTPSDIARLSSRPPSSADTRIQRF